MQQSGFQLDDRDYPSYIDWLETQGPNDPEDVAYRQKRQQAEDDQQVARDEQDDEQWARKMLVLAEAQERDDEEPMTNDEIERYFAGGTGPFAD